MVHGHDDIIRAFDRAQKHSVGRLRVADVEPALAGGAHGRQDLALLLVAEQAALAGVRVQPSDAMRGSGMPSARQDS